MIIAAPRVSAPPMPSVLAESVRLDGAIRQAQQRARADAERLVPLGEAGPSDEQLIAFAIDHVGAPPGAIEQRRELGILHAFQATRTPAGTEQAQWLAAHGDGDVWREWAQGIGSSGPTDARAAAELVERALQLADEAKSAAKLHFARPRPYDVDPTLDPIFEGGAIFDPTKKSFGYPSGHTSEAYAAAEIVSGIAPARSAEFAAMARRVADSRMYSGVHYPSDIVAGAYLGTLVGAALLRRAATPPLA